MILWKFVRENVELIVPMGSKKMGWVPLYPSLAHELKEHRGVPPCPSSQAGRSWWKEVPEHRRTMWTQPGVTGAGQGQQLGPSVSQGFGLPFSAALLFLC